MLLWLGPSQGFTPWKADDKKRLNDRSRLMNNDFFSLLQLFNSHLIFNEHVATRSKSWQTVDVQVATGLAVPNSGAINAGEATWGHLSWAQKMGRNSRTLGKFGVKPKSKLLMSSYVQFVAAIPNIGKISVPAYTDAIRCSCSCCCCSCTLAFFRHQSIQDLVTPVMQRYAKHFLQ